MLMHLEQLPNLINAIFTILELVIVRCILIGLLLLGAYSLFKGHH